MDEEFDWNQKRRDFGYPDLFIKPYPFEREEVVFANYNNKQHDVSGVQQCKGKKLW